MRRSVFWMMLFAAAVFVFPAAVACGDDDDEEEDEEEPAEEEDDTIEDVFGTCVDEVDRLYGDPNGCVVQFWPTADIQNACSSVEGMAASECGNEAAQALLQCLLAIECGDTDAANEAWDICWTNYENDSIGC
ncbi:MAG: hypothetical protein M5R36_18855 [Deltaproteobacteria bacterium]|nr:hypothetical protein [Deltaproteobacteria bacterium]